MLSAARPPPETETLPTVNAWPVSPVSTVSMPCWVKYNTWAAAAFCTSVWIQAGGEAPALYDPLLCDAVYQIAGLSGVHGKRVLWYGGWSIHLCILFIGDVRHLIPSLYAPTTAAAEPPATAVLPLVVLTSATVMVWPLAVVIASPFCTAVQPEVQASP